MTVVHAADVAIGPGSIVLAHTAGPEPQAEREPEITAGPRYVSVFVAVV